MEGTNMTDVEKRKKLASLPWQALYDLAIKKEIEESQIKGKEKSVIISKLLIGDLLSDNEVDNLVNDYIYGDRVSFTLWNFEKKLLKEQYDVVAGNWPSAYNEVVLIVNEEHEISDYTLYTLGLKSHDEIDGLFMKIVNGEEVSFENTTYEYDDFIGLTFKLVLNADYYDKQGNIWVNRQNDEKYMKELIKNGTDIKIVGIIKPNEEALMSDSHGLIGYTSELTKYVINDSVYFIRLYRDINWSFFYLIFFI